MAIQALVPDRHPDCRSVLVKDAPKRTVHLLFAVSCRVCPGYASVYMLSRLILAYCLVPLVPPLVMLTWSGAWRMPFGDWFGILLLYAVIGAGAMTVFGTPLVLLYKWRGWTGWGTFMVGGGLCAMLTSIIFLSSSPTLSQVPFFTALGILAGLVFRFVLYGSHRVLSPRSSPRQRI